uniref:Uncharacterized protein n=1 Tax=Arundo donax TaxID=35708 RepID=A0A0A8Y468_ARUDO
MVQLGSFMPQVLIINLNLVASEFV